MKRALLLLMLVVVIVLGGPGRAEAFEVSTSSPRFSMELVKGKDELLCMYVPKGHTGSPDCVRLDRGVLERGADKLPSGDSQVIAAGLLRRGDATSVVVVMKQTGGVDLSDDGAEYVEGFVRGLDEGGRSRSTVNGKQTRQIDGRECVQFDVARVLGDEREVGRALLIPVDDSLYVVWATTAESERAWMEAFVGRSVDTVHAAPVDRKWARLAGQVTAYVGVAVGLVVWLVRRARKSAATPPYAGHYTPGPGYGPGPAYGPGPSYGPGPADGATPHGPPAPGGGPARGTGGPGSGTPTS